MKIWIVVARRPNGPDKRVYFHNPFKAGWVPEGARYIVIDLEEHSIYDIDDWPIWNPS